jgi:hypothetical protein
VLLVKYEEMVTDYRRWLEKFINPFPIDDKRKVIEEWAARSQAFFPKRANDAMNHVRHVTPGDYKAKLQPSTIRALDQIFSGTLDALGYEKYGG